jgi:hypothetical protein
MTTNKAIMRDEILNTPAGEPMDILIAELIMGETYPTYTHEQLHLEYPKTSTLGNWQCFNIFEHGDVCEWHPRPFSSDISAAWAVAEKLKSDGWEFYFEWKDKPWALFENDEFLLDRCADADTASLAICRAALLTTLEGK